MIEPRAIVADDNGHAIAVWLPVNKPPIKVGDKLVTVADVLAALRHPSEAMLDAGWFKTSATRVQAKSVFLAMLDQFEKEQSGDMNANN